MVYAKVPVQNSPCTSMRISLRKIRIVIALSLLGAARAASAQQTSYAGTDSVAREAQVRARANDLLKQMTLEEKVAQLSQLPALSVPEFKQNTDETIEQIIARVGAGSVLWVSDPKEINRLQHISVEKSRLHIPIFFVRDVIR